VTQLPQLNRSAHRRAGGLLCVLVALVLTGCTSTGTLASKKDAGDASSSQGGSKAGGSKDGDSTATGKSGSALKLLATITVKGRAPQTGYSRDEFGPAWSDTDHNGCDQRNDVLRRDLTAETIKPGTHGCIVLTGTLVDKYTGQTIHFQKSSATAVQIDHVVALENAWVTGAYHWSPTKRRALATDPLNLLAVDGPTNESKGSGDAATWLPPQKSYRCAYVARQVAVKSKYDAWMTAAEKKAIKTVLSSCPDQKVPTSTGPVPAGPGGPAKASASGAGSSPTKAGKAKSDSVTAGAFCSPEGDTAVTSDGKKMTCRSKDGDPARWRSAT
jgi:hypothetical protein